MNDLLLRLGHSPDPDDAFMFYGLAKNLLPTGRYHFEHVLQDIQTLSDRATQGLSERQPRLSTVKETWPVLARACLAPSHVGGAYWQLGPPPGSS